MNQIKIFNLSKITDRIGEILNPHIGKTFWVKAEISSAREKGGFYCLLIETDASGKIIAKMQCNIWQRDLSIIKERFSKAGLPSKLENGTIVVLKCSIKFHPEYGLSLNAIDADPSFSLGELELKKREILERLKKEGLLEINKRIPVPLLPLKIGLITSHNSAAYNDFIKTIISSRFGFKIYLADSLMQGGQTEKSIIKALDCLSKLKLDLVVIIRGGGSKIDLYSLDNEVIAKMIAGYNHPVWTGIGHEIDTSVLDSVANLSFKTPTAVSEEIVARFFTMQQSLEESKYRFRSKWKSSLLAEQKRILENITKIINGTDRLLETTSAKLKQDVYSLSSIVQKKIHESKTILNLSTNRLLTLPLNYIRKNHDAIKEKTKWFKTTYSRIIDGRNKDLKSFKGRFKLTRFKQRINIENEYVLSSVKQIKQRSKKLIESRFDNLKKDALRLSSTIKDSLNKAENKLELSTNKLKTSPNNYIQKNQNDILEKKGQLKIFSNRRVEEKVKDLNSLINRFKPARIKKNIQSEKQSINIKKDQLKRQYLNIFSNRKKDTDQLKKRLSITKVLKRVKDEREKIESVQSILTASDPKTSLKRGFSLMYNKNGKLIKSIKNVIQKENIVTKVSDGKILSTVNELGLIAQKNGLFEATSHTLTRLMFYVKNLFSNLPLVFLQVIEY